LSLQSFFKDNVTTHFSASLLAGLVATTVCSPFDVIKTRIMNSKGKEYKVCFFPFLSFFSLFENRPVELSYYYYYLDQL